MNSTVPQEPNLRRFRSWTLASIVSLFAVVVIIASCLVRGEPPGRAAITEMTSGVGVWAGVSFALETILRASNQGDPGPRDARLIQVLLALAVFGSLAFLGSAIIRIGIWHGIDIVDLSVVGLAVIAFQLAAAVAFLAAVLLWLRRSSSK